MKPAKRRERDRKERKKNRAKLKESLSSGVYTIEVNGQRFTYEGPSKADEAARKKAEAESVATIVKQINASGLSVQATTNGNTVTLRSTPAQPFTVSAPPDPVVKRTGNRASRRIRR